MTTPQEPPRAGRKEWIGLAVLGLPTILISLDLGVLYLALPRLSAHLAPSGTQTLWIMDIYSFMTASLLLTMGTVGDRVGRRRLLMIGAAAFGVASVLAAYSTSAEMLIATRALLGIAGATLAPSTLALISTMFQNAKERSTAIGVWMGCFMLGAAIGPVIGGLLLQSFWWGSVFLIGLPVMLLLLVLAPIVLPPDHHTGDARPLDLPSTALVLATMLPLVFSLKQIAHEDHGVLTWVALAAGLVCGVLFVRRQLALEHPLIDVRLLAIPSFSGALGLLLLGPAVMGGIGLFLNQYLQMVQGLSPLEAGLVTVPPALSTVVAAILAPAAAARVGAGRTLVTGSLILVAGAVVLTTVDVHTNLLLVVFGLALISFGFGPIASLGTGMIIATAPPAKAGAAASISETASELGIGLGVGLLGALGSMIYRNDVADRLPAAAAGDHAARDNLAGALRATGQLPKGVASAVIEAARQAFTTGLTVVAGVCVAIGVVLVVVSAVLLRDITPVDPLAQDGAAEPESEPAHS